MASRPAFPASGAMDGVHTGMTGSLAHRGFVRGWTLSTSTSTSTSTSSETAQEEQPRPSPAQDTRETRAEERILCHYFGGVRYALPPLTRWRRARPLPGQWRYGTRETPGFWWPVFFFIHGGFLQFGSPNTYSLAALLGETAFQCVVVMPAYRLGVLGFLASEEMRRDAEAAGEDSVGNQGFWDQRLALEWTRANIGLFGGDPRRITVGGYSAGAYSAFHQLAHDLYLPHADRIVKQAIMWSNGPGMQPRSSSDAQAQFDELLSALGIPLSLAPREKLARLRSLPASALLAAGSRIRLHQFRPAITGDSPARSFIPPTLFADIDSGVFSAKLLERKTRLLLGECRDEHVVYGRWRPPTQNTRAALRARLEADYPAAACDALMGLYFPGGELPARWADWDGEAFGRVYADLQVHLLQRGLVRALTRGNNHHDASGGGADNGTDTGPRVDTLIYRYRIEYRVRCVDETVPPAWGVTHGTDQAIWFWGNGGALLPAEKDTVRTAFLDPLWKFVSCTGDGIGWGADGPRRVRRLRPDGGVDVWDDDEGMWEVGGRVWDVLRGVDGSAGADDVVSSGRRLKL
ncbi:hypothetical protein VTN02DRAFT_1815 [Thermoascus thermophilus]